MASIVQQISLSLYKETISATSYTEILYPTYRLWDSSLYDGTVEVYFEATLDPNGATRTTYAALYDEDGNQVEGSEISAYGGDYNNPILKRSSAITLTTGKTYRVRAYRAVGNGVLYGARLVIKQSGTITKTATYIDFAGDYDTTTGGNYSAVGKSSKWLHDADMYDGVSAIYFEGTMKHSTGAYTAGLELYNTTNSAQVTELGSTSTSFESQRSDDIKASIADAKAYAIRSKDGGGGTCYISGVSLIIVQQNFTKSCSLLTVNHNNSVTQVSEYLPATAYINHYFRFTKGDWSTKTITAKFFAHTAYGYNQQENGVGLRRWNTTNAIVDVNPSSTAIPPQQMVSDDIYSSLDSDNDYRAYMYAFSDANGASTTCCNYGLQVEFTLPVNYTLAATGSSYSVTGTAATLKKSKLVSAGAGSYSVTGTAATLTYTASGPKIEAGIGSYTLNGTAASFKYSRIMPVSPGSYSVTGTAAGLCYSRICGVTAGSYSITGTASGLLCSRALPIEAGSYDILAKSTSELLYSQIFNVAPGSFTVTGTAATFPYNRIFTAAPGSFAVSGAAATLTYTRNTITLAAGSADFYILGPIGGRVLKKTLSILPASSGSYAMTGTAANFLRSRIMPVSSGSYGATGTAATFLYNRVFTESPGAFTVTGTEVDFIAGMGIAATHGSFAVTGTAAGLCKSYVFAVSEGTFTVTGTAATFVETKGITASPGEFSVAGTEATLLKHSVLVADPDKSSTVITRHAADAVYGEFAQESLTTTYTPADLPDDIVIVSFALDSRAEIGSVTLGGRAFTRLAYVEGTGSGYHRGELWYLVNPPHEESEFSITLNDPQGTWTLFRIEHYYNVNQYDPFGDVAATFAAGKYGITSTVEDVKEGQFPFDWIVNTVTWYTITPGAEQTVIGSIINFGHFASAMSHRFGDTGDLEFSWSFPGIAGDNIHIATVLKQPAFRNTFTIDGSAVDLLKVVEMTIHDASHAITASGTVLIVAGTYELVIDGSVHAVTMDNVTLTMPDTLTINDAAHAITMQNVGLVMPGVLTINDAVHQVTMPDISLGGIAYGGIDAMIQIGGEWKDISTIRVQVGGAWKDVTDITLRQ